MLYRSQAIKYSSVNNCTQPIALQLLHPPYHFNFQSSQISYKFTSLTLNLTLLTLTPILTLLTILTPHCNMIGQFVATWSHWRVQLFADPYWIASFLSCNWQYKLMKSTVNHWFHHHHNRFTALFPGPPRWAGARRVLLDFVVQGKINRGRHTDHPAGRHSIRTNQCLPPPSPHVFLQAGSPTNSVKALKATSAFGLGRIC